MQLRAPRRAPHAPIRGHHCKTGANTKRGRNAKAGRSRGSGEAVKWPRPSRKVRLLLSKFLPRPGIALPGVDPRNTNTRGHTSTGAPVLAAALSVVTDTLGGTRLSSVVGSRGWAVSRGTPTRGLHPHPVGCPSAVRSVWVTLRRTVPKGPVPRPCARRSHSHRVRETTNLCRWTAGQRRPAAAEGGRRPQSGPLTERLRSLLTTPTKPTKQFCVRERTARPCTHANERT